VTIVDDGVACAYGRTASRPLCPGAPFAALDARVAGNANPRILPFSGRSPPLAHRVLARMRNGARRRIRRSARPRITANVYNSRPIFHFLLAQRAYRQRSILMPADSPMVTPALSVRALSKRFELYDRPVDRLKQTLWRGRRQFYRDFWALRDIGFSLAPGQALGVVGRNGSGKSTLLQLVAGTLAPTSGEIDAPGRVSALLELGSGFNPEFSGRENVFLNGAILGLPYAEMRALMPELLAFADIGDFVDRPVKTYSSGMALRLAFAVATAVAPRILIVDEALAVGDEAFQRKCFARIEKIRESGAAILFVSHSSQQILELCDAALLLDGGEMLLLDEPRRVVPEYQRILYASPEAAVRLRQRLVTEGANGGDAAHDPTTRHGHADDRSADDADRASARPVRAELDPDLRSASTVEYASHGARIHAPGIATPDGMAVNVLVRGDAYVFSYEVEFLQPATRVRFGMMIKTTTGVELGGGTYPDAGVLEGEFPAGARVRLRFEFRCYLFPGTYFLNAGLFGEVGGTSTYLHRLVDAVALRVQPDASGKQSGYVDFAIRAALSPVEDRG
jgi:lipopolysaccharide transport system ATP-binding protein